MSGMLRVRRTRGALSGVLLMLLGAWGAIVAFIGPTFGYAYTPAAAWSFSSGRFWLELLPGIAALLGGLLVLVSASRPVTLFGAWLAAVSGGWFVVGTIVAPTWINARITAGTPVGSTSMRALEQIGFFLGLGVVIVFLAAAALGRLSVIAAGDRTTGKPVEASPPSSARKTLLATDRALLERWRNKLVASGKGAGSAQDERTTVGR